MTWPGDLTFGDLDLKFSGMLRNSCPNSYAKNGGAARCREKNSGGVFTSPPPSWVRVKTIYHSLKRTLEGVWVSRTQHLGRRWQILPLPATSAPIRPSITKLGWHNSTQWNKWCAILVNLGRYFRVKWGQTWTLNNREIFSQMTDLYLFQSQSSMWTIIARIKLKKHLIALKTLFPLCEGSLVSLFWRREVHT